MVPATDILLIEDEPNIAEAVRFILTRDGWRLDHWSEGSQALARIAALFRRVDALAQPAVATGQGAAALHPGLEAPGPWIAPGLDRGADLLGAGLLAQAWHDAPAPIRLRADWKLAPAAVDTPAVRAASTLDARGARQLCLQLLARLDPAWLSSFPATR